jgi:MGT family glycosyltransferase
MSLNVLLTSWGTAGNLSPLLTAARRLRRRGHRVRIITEAANQEETTKAGFESLCWRRPAPFTPPDTGADAATGSEIRAIFERLMFGAAIDYAADTLDALRAEPADAVLTHDFLAGPVIAAEAAGIPCALLSPHVSIRPIDGVPSAGTGLVPSDQPEQQAEQAAANASLVELLRGCLPILNRARAAFGLLPHNDTVDHYDCADRVLIGMSPAFDFPARKNLPANLRYVGPLLDPPAWSRPWIAPWSGRPVRPRVLVSLSTTFQDQAALLRRIIAALGTMAVDAVVTTGPAMVNETFQPPANVAIVHSAPHDAVMKDVSLVVTHGGHGTVMRSLVNGVPLLVVPMGRDQGDNAARVVARGAGLALADTGSEQEVAAAIRQLIAEPRFRTAAARLGASIAPDTNSPALVAEMEAMATRRWRRSA